MQDTLVKLLGQAVRSSVPNWAVTLIVLSDTISLDTSSSPASLATATTSARSFSDISGICASSAIQLAPEGAATGNATLPDLVGRRVIELANAACSISRLMIRRCTSGGTRTPLKLPEPTAGGDGMVIGVAFQRRAEAGRR